MNEKMDRRRHGHDGRMMMTVYLYHWISSNRGIFFWLEPIMYHYYSVSRTQKTAYLYTGKQFLY
jgi:hypothetical protein